MHDAQTMMVRPANHTPTKSAVLVVLDAPQSEANWTIGRQIDLPLSTSIGRHSSNTITLDDQRVSRLHCRIEARRDGYYLIDEGSANGTIVSGRTVCDARLNLEEVIQVGPFRLLFWEGKTNDPLFLKRLAHAGIHRRPSP